MRALHTLIPVLTLLACDGGGGAAPGVSGLSQPRLPGSSTGGGDADGLAAALLLAADVPVPRVGRPQAPVADPSLADELTFLAHNHLEAAALGSGAGARIIGSRRIRRLALEPGAPPDRNGVHGNLDETLDAELRRITRVAGGDPTPGAAHLLFPWRAGTADLAAPLGDLARSRPSAWRTVPSITGVVELGQVGRAIHARALLLGRLLADSRGSFAGRTTADGVLGIELLHQVLAAEETLIGSLFYDGRMLGELSEPRSYDPAQGLRWIPASFAVAEDPPGSGVPAAYRPWDGSSSLSANAALLSAAAELAWLADDGNRDPDLRDLFRGFPFGEPGGPVRPRRAQPDSGTLNFVEDIQPLIGFRCGGCHGFAGGSGGFNTSSLQTIMMGGNRTRARGLQMIVPFDHERSVLWQVLTPNPPPSFLRMPLGGMLPPGEISLIADWIDQGAVENPTSVPPPPEPGRDFAEVLFRNIVAMHLERSTFALHHRHGGDAPSGLATAEATGRALLALSSLASLDPKIEHDGVTIGGVVGGVAVRAARSLFDEDGFALDSVAIVGGGTGPRADLLGHSALTAGMLAALPFLDRTEDVEPATQAAVQRLLDAFFGPDGLLRDDPEFAGARYRPAELEMALEALHRAAADGRPGALEARDRFLARIRPVLAYAEWDGRGEVLGDGIADTDGDGIPEPALAGGAFGRLPLLAGEIAVGLESARPPPSTRVTWSRHVKPLLLSKCAQCHLNGNAMGDYRLDTPASLRTPGESGGVFPLVVPGDPERSFLYRKVADRDPPIGVQMPQALPPLDASGKALLFEWIAQGATAR